MNPENFDMALWLPDWLPLLVGAAAILWIGWVLFQSMPRNRR